MIKQAADCSEHDGAIWCRIRAGCFIMGSPEYEPGRREEEVQHQVVLTHDFEIMQAEVTQAQWQEVAQAEGWGLNPSWFGPNGDGQDCGMNCPVERVSWHDAIAYANIISDMAGLRRCYVGTNISGSPGTGCSSGTTDCIGSFSATIILNGTSTVYECEGYRLATEAEWEYAYRAGTTTAFYNREITNAEENCNVDSALDLIGYYCGNSNTITHSSSMAKNEWGLIDMAGNVREWVWDLYGPYSQGMAIDPIIQSGSFRTFRGGSWGNPAVQCRAAFRLSAPPATRRYDIGFRLARTLP